MAQKPLPYWRRQLALPKAHRTRKEVNGVVYLRVTAGRHAGAPVLGTYQGVSQADAEMAFEADAEGIRERYQAAVDGLPTLATIAGLLSAWERSAEFEGKSTSTKIERARVLSSIRASALGKASASILKQPGAQGVITKWRDKEAAQRGERAADYRIEVLNAALNWHARQGNIAKNPALGIADVYRGDRSDLIWEPAHVEAFLEYIRSEIARVWGETKPGPRRFKQVARLANARDTLLLALNTGMRRADLAGLTALSIRDGAIIYTPGKSRNRARTSKKPARTVVLPILPQAALVLARRAEAGFEQRILGGYTPHSQGALVLDIAETLEIDRHLHDAKGTFVTRLAVETDLTDQEIAELVDWSVANVQNIKRKYVSGAAVNAALLKRFRRG